MQALETLNEMLEHIRIVERETVELMNEAHIRLVAFLQKHSLSLDDEMLEVMQYQDIITQQLTATVEVAEYAQAHLHQFGKDLAHENNDITESFKKLDTMLQSTLKRAREKHAAFGGKIQHRDTVEIEFF